MNGKKSLKPLIINLERIKPNTQKKKYVANPFYNSWTEEQAKERLSNKELAKYHAKMVLLPELRSIGLNTIEIAILLAIMKSKISYPSSYKMYSHRAKPKKSYSNNLMNFEYWEDLIGIQNIFSPLQFTKFHEHIQNLQDKGLLKKIDLKTKTLIENMKEKPGKNFGHFTVYLPINLFYKYPNVKTIIHLLQIGLKEIYANNPGSAHEHIKNEGWIVFNEGYVADRASLLVNYNKVDFHK